LQILEKQSSLDPKIETSTTVVGSVVVWSKRRQLIQHHQLTPIRSHRRIDTGFKWVRSNADPNWLLNLRKMPISKVCRRFDPLLLTSKIARKQYECKEPRSGGEVNSPSQRLVLAPSTVDIGDE
jgi:hypothetical protein